MTRGGKEAGVLLEDSFVKLQKALASDQRSNASLCKYFGGDDDCTVSYGAPRCSGGAINNASRTAAVGASDVTREFPTEALKDRLKEEKEFADALKTFTTAQMLVDVVQDGPAAVLERARTQAADKLRAAFAERHRSTDEYITQLEGALSRLRAGKNAISDCVRDVNPFATYDAAPMHGDGIPRLFGSAVYGGGIGWPITPPSYFSIMRQAEYDGHSAVTALLARGSAGDLRQLSLTRQGVVRATSYTGLGRIILGRSGVPRQGDAISAGTHPVAFVFGNAKAPRIVPPEIVVTQAGPDTVVTLRGASPLGQHAVEILSCAPGRLTAGTTCACPGNSKWTGATEGATVCACPSGLHWSGSACECPANSHNINGECRVCVGGATWTGSSCECPAKQKWHVDKCIQDAPAPIAPSGDGLAPVATCDAFEKQHGIFNYKAGTSEYAPETNQRYCDWKKDWIPDPVCMIYDVGADAFNVHLEGPISCAATPFSRKEELRERYKFCCVPRAAVRKRRVAK